MLAGAFGIEELDDAAPMEDEERIFLSSDMMIQSTDLPSNTNPLFWGHRFIASNVSDISAMGCKPTHMLVSLGLPRDMPIRDFRKILEGMQWGCREADVRIIGGDTNSSAEIILSGFVAGTPFGRAFRRWGARPGDGVFVTGTPGLAALGLAIIQCNRKTDFESPDVLEESMPGSAAAVAAFLVPQMRVHESQELSGLGVVTSCIDVSDGLSTDAGHIAESSGVQLILDETRLPFGPEARGIAKHLSLDPLDLAFNGGDDYELLFTASPGAEEAIEKKKIATRIGEVAQGQGVFVRRGDGRLEILKSSGYQHFGGRNP